MIHQEQPGETNQTIATNARKSRNRGCVLTAIGQEKIEAKLKNLEINRKNAATQISNRIEIGGNKLDRKTVEKIINRERNADKSSIKLVFSDLNLKLEKEDYTLEFNLQPSHHSLNKRNWKVLSDVKQYITQFHDFCKMEKHIEAFNVILDKDDYDNSVYNFLEVHNYQNQIIELFEELLHSWKISDCEKWEFCITLACLGSAYRSAGKYEKAIGCHKRSLEIAKELNDHRTEAGSLIDLGLVYLLTNDPQALKFTREGLYIARQLNNRFFEADALNNLGLMLSFKGEYYKAIDYHHNSLEISRQIGNSLGTASALFLIGRNHLMLAEANGNLGEYRHALRFLQQSLETAHEIGASKIMLDAQSELALTYLNMALTLERLSLNSEAIDACRKALDLFQEAGLNFNAKYCMDFIQRLSGDQHNFSLEFSAV